MTARRRVTLADTSAICALSKPSFRFFRSSIVHELDLLSSVDSLLRLSAQGHVVMSFSFSSIEFLQDVSRPKDATRLLATVEMYLRMRTAQTRITSRKNSLIFNISGVLNTKFFVKIFFFKFLI